MIEKLFNDLINNMKTSQLEAISKDIPVDTGRLNEAVDYFGRNTREFGINECKEDAKRIFSPDVIERWPEMSPEEREQLAKEYGECVAKNFDLKNYRGVVFEPMSPDTNGYNQGDGIAHLTDRMIKEQMSPLQIVDTLTHELRHQYQVECVNGLHYVPDDTRLEWAAGMETYTNQVPWAFDPWGYKYNPLETDARYAGESVVRELTKDFINGQFA
jgi:hypothetical protein